MKHAAKTNVDQATTEFEIKMGWVSSQILTCLKCALLCAAVAEAQAQQVLSDLI